MLGLRSRKCIWAKHDPHQLRREVGLGIGGRFAPISILCDCPFFGQFPKAPSSFILSFISLAGWVQLSSLLFLYFWRCALWVQDRLMTTPQHDSHDAHSSGRRPRRLEVIVNGSSGDCQYNLSLGLSQILSNVSPLQLTTKAFCCQQQSVPLSMSPLASLTL